MSETDQVVSLLMQATKILVQIADLGPIGYAIIGIVSVALFMLRAWLKRQAVNAARQLSAEQAVKDQASNVTENQRASRNWEAAHDTIERGRRSEPDQGKKPR